MKFIPVFLAATVCAASTGNFSHIYNWQEVDCKSVPGVLIITESGDPRITGTCDPSLSTSCTNNPEIENGSFRRYCSATRDLSLLQGQYVYSKSGGTELYEMTGKCRGHESGAYRNYKIYQCTGDGVIEKTCKDTKCEKGCSSNTVIFEI